MKLTNFLLISSLFVAVLFFMSACDNAVGSKLPAINASSGRENYCRVDGDCSPDGYIGAYFCQNGDVYRNFRDYSCVSRVCTYNTNAMLIDDCGTNETCVNGMAECQPVTNQTSHKICSGNSCVTVQGAGSNECNVNGDCQVNQTYFTYTLEYDVSIDISEAGGNYSSYTSQPGYYLHTTTQDSIKLVQEGVFTDKLWIVYEPEIFANRLFYEDSTGHTKEAMTFRNGNEEQTLNFDCSNGVTHTLEYDVSIDISEAGGNYSSYTSQPGYYLHTTTQDSIKLVQEGVFTDKLWIVYEPEIFANRLFYEDSTGHTKEAMTFRNGNEEQTLNFVC